MKTPWWKKPLEFWFWGRDLGLMIQHVGEDVAALPTKEDIAALAAAVKALRDELTKPELTIRPGNPTDQEH